MARFQPICAVLVLALTACGDALSPSDAFLWSRSRWERRGPANYVYEFRRSCECILEAVQPVRITVSNGQVTTVVRVADGQPVPPDQVNLFFRVTIDSLFAEIADAIERDAYLIAATYHFRWGYPMEVSIDYVGNAADDEMSFTSVLQGP